MAENLEIKRIAVSDRQRSRMNSEKKASLRQSIIERGLLHAIGVWYDPNFLSVKDGKQLPTPPKLVYGGRRLATVTQLAEEGIPIRYDGAEVPLGFIPTVRFETSKLSVVRGAELEENTEREDLDWEDRVRALAEIHDLKKQENPNQTVLATARELAAAPNSATGAAVTVSGIRSTTSFALAIAPHLDDPEVKKAKSISDAFQIVMKQEQQKVDAELVRRRGLSSSSQIQLICGDALVELTKLPANSVDLILTDPPYGIDADSNNFSRRTAVSHTYLDDPKTVLDMLQKFLIEAWRVCKPKANLFMFCDPDHFGFLKGAATRAAFTPFRTPIIWDKLTPGVAPWQTEGFQRSYEFILFAKKGDHGLYTPTRDVMSFGRVPKTSKRHGAEKPVNLLELLIEISTYPGDLVLDPFAGSFSSVVAAKAKNRRAIGIELDKNHVDAAMVELFGGKNE